MTETEELARLLESARVWAVHLEHEVEQLRDRLAESEAKRLTLVAEGMRLQDENATLRAGWQM